MSQLQSAEDVCQHGITIVVITQYKYMTVHTYKCIFGKQPHVQENLLQDMYCCWLRLSTKRGSYMYMPGWALQQHNTTYINTHCLHGCCHAWHRNMSYFILVQLGCELRCYCSFTSNSCCMVWCLCDLKNVLWLFLQNLLIIKCLSWVVIVDKTESV